jgi:threonine dehydrogenase-like Zn-dependent dehydrogenase
VAVAGCGICGTDLHILDGEFAPTLLHSFERAGELFAAGVLRPDVMISHRVRNR